MAHMEIHGGTLKDSGDIVASKDSMGTVLRNSHVGPRWTSHPVIVA